MQDPKWVVEVEMSIEYNADLITSGYSLFRKIRSSIDKILDEEKSRSGLDYKLTGFSMNQSSLNGSNDED